MVIVTHVYQTTHCIYMISLNEQNNQPVLQHKHTSNIKAITTNVYSVSSRREIIAYHQKCLLSPTTSTWIEEINYGLFVTCPGLNADIVEKYFPKYVSITKGYMNQQRQKIRSTKNKKIQHYNQQVMTNTARAIHHLSHTQNYMQ